MRTVDAAHEPERYSRTVSTWDRLTSNRRNAYGQWGRMVTAGLAEPDCVTLAERVDRPVIPMERPSRPRPTELAELLHLPEWWEQANCLGMDPAAFHAKDGDKAAVATARLICQGCEVQAQCLDRAIEIRGIVGRDNDHGVWAGTTPQERTRIVAARRRGAA